MDDAAIASIARQQHGLISRAQVLASGGSDRAISGRLRRQVWRRIRPGVYAVGAIPDGWNIQVMAACLAGGTDVVASHRTAARLWGLVDRSGRIEVTAGDGRRLGLIGVQGHRSLLLPDLDVDQVAGIPTTTISRTIVDASAHQPAATVGGWIDRSLRNGQLDLLDLRACIARLSGPGRRDLRTTRQALAVRLPGYDPGDSDLEVRALRVLAGAGLPPPVQQHPVCRPDGSMAYLDLAYPPALVGIEIDGWSAHGSFDAFTSDRARRNDLTELGWRMFQFTARMSDRCLATTVERALATVPPTAGFGAQPTRAGDSPPETTGRRGFGDGPT